MRHPFGIALMGGCLSLVGGAAAIDIDGARDVEYGAPLAVQAAQTGFGDPGSELDAGYGLVSGGKLYLLLTGNLEANFNKLEIFIDSVGGGQNTIDMAANPNNDNWAVQFDGFTFDAGFAADYMLIVRHGFGGTQFDIDFAELGAGGAGGTVGTFDPTAPPSTGPFETSNAIRVGFDNTNTGGVGAAQGSAADQAAAAAVATGLELEIPLALLGQPAAGVKVCAMINGSEHSFLSNQFLGPLPADATNLGTDGAGNFVADTSLGGIDLGDFAGDQFFTVLPEQLGPAIIAVEVDRPGGRVSLTWTSRPGAVYRVQSSLDLISWDEVTDEAFSQGLTTTYDDLGADTAQPRLFYRVIEA